MARLRDCRVLVADDHQVVSAGLVNLLQPHCRMVSTAHSLEELWLRLHDAPPELVVLDISFGSASSLHELPAIRRRFPEVRFVVLTAHGPVLKAAALRAGASAYVSKTAEPREVIEALHQVIRDDHTPGPDTAVAAPALAPQIDPTGLRLTSRQVEVLTILLNGLTQREAADQLGISRRTVEYHLDELRRRTGIRRMPLLLAWFRDRQQSVLESSPS